MTEENKKQHISYSAIKTLKQECPFKFKLLYVDRIERAAGNIFSSFGKAMHSMCENKLKDDTVNEVEFFVKSFEEEIKILKKDNVELEEKDISDFMEQGKMLAPLFLPKLKSFFGDFEFIAAEEELYEQIKEYTKSEVNFKGFIDLILKTKDGKYHIIDSKTTSWGWKEERKTDAITTYQLTLYKKFFAQKHNINMDDIETYFCLLKRTAKNDNIEIFRVTSGDRKVNNAMSVVNECLNIIEKGYFPKNKLTCKYCICKDK